MEKPRELKIKKCPFGCDVDIELIKEKQNFSAKGQVYQGERWLYKCPSCKEGFTTTESDTISMENLKVRKQWWTLVIFTGLLTGLDALLQYNGLGYIVVYYG